MQGGPSSRRILSGLSDEQEDLSGNEDLSSRSTKAVVNDRQTRPLQSLPPGLCEPCISAQPS